MAYVRKKRVGEHTYYQLVEGYRKNGKVYQRVLCHLGRQETPEAALNLWQKRAEQARQMVRDYRHAAEYVRLGRARWLPYYYFGGLRWRRLVPRAATPLDSTPIDGDGWHQLNGSAEDIERRAREYVAKAERWDERAERLRSVL